MKEKIKGYCNKPTLILAAALIGAIGGGIIGVLAYYGQWLG
jgi:hypothetical protein